MNLSAIATVSHEPFTPGEPDDMGIRPDGWAAPVSVDTFGWWTASPDTAGDGPGRRWIERDVDMMIPASTVCGDKDRWTVAGTSFLQVAGPQDYNHGPFGMAVPLIVYLKRVEG